MSRLKRIKEFLEANNIKDDATGKSYGNTRITIRLSEIINTFLTSEEKRKERKGDKVKKYYFKHKEGHCTEICKATSSEFYIGSANCTHKCSNNIGFNNTNKHWIKCTKLNKALGNNKKTK